MIDLYLLIAQAMFVLLTVAYLPVPFIVHHGS